MLYSKKTTNKLFFKKYTNKVAVRTPLAATFRGADLPLIRSKLLAFENHLERNKTMSVSIGSSWSRNYARIDDLLIATKLVDTLEDLSDFSLRIEHLTVGIYFNDDDFLDTVTGIAGIHIEETSEPFDSKSKQFLLENPGVIIRTEYTHKYKVTVRSLWSDSVNFKEWAGKYDKIKLMPSNKYKFGGHFYVADDKMLSLCRLYLSDKITKIEELVTCSEM